MCLLLLLCVTIELVPLIQAPSTPTNTTTSTSDGSETSEPLWVHRTLWSIASSCALTIFACIYNAIHPNIPGPKDSHLRILRRRLGIAAMALIAPELIVAWAMRQWLSARRVTAQFKEHFSYLPPQGHCESKSVLSNTLNVSTHRTTHIQITSVPKHLQSNLKVNRTFYPDDVFLRLIYNKIKSTPRLP